MQQIEKYPIGSFVWLKKHSEVKLNKTQVKYHQTPYRILKRYKTNALLLPYNKMFYFQRIKREGRVSKNLCTIQRLSNLKPIKDVRQFLNLEISDKLLLNFFSYLESSFSPPIQATLMHPKAKNMRPSPLLDGREFHISPDTIIQDVKNCRGPRDDCKNQRLSCMTFKEKRIKC